MTTTPIEDSIDAVSSLPPYHDVDEILAHPRFRDATADLIGGLIGLYAYDPRLRGLIEYDRAVSFMLMICIAAGHDEAKPESWLTLTTLTQILPQLGITPGRNITELVAMLRKDGFLESRPAPTDRRIKILVPTDRMLGLDREWLKIFHRPLALMFPQDDYRGALAEEPAYQAAYRQASMLTLGLADRIVGGNPPADYFIKENVGTRILMVMLQETMERGDRRTHAGFYTRAAERCGVSRTHVRNILQGAADRGFVLLSPRRGDFVEATAELCASMDRWFAEALAGTDIVHALALQMHPSDPSDDGEKSPVA